MRVVLAEHRHGGGDSLRRVLLGEGLLCDAADVVAYDELPARLAASDADLVLVNCDVDPAAALQAIQAAHHTTGAPIFACGRLTDAAPLRAALRAGAKEFLELDRLREELSEALVKIGAESETKNSLGINVALYSPSGGAGVSTAAVNLAAHMAKKHPNEVALIDLKAAPSDMALLLDLEPKQTSNYVLRSWERLDRQMLKGSMTVHASGVHVLPQDAYPAAGGAPENHLTRAGVRQALVLLRRAYRFSILDLDHELNDITREALRLSNFIGLIVRPDVPGLHRARWALESAVAGGVPRERFRLVLNRYGGSGQIQVKKVEEILGIKVFQTIPEDVGVVSKAANQGSPVHALSKLSRISRSFSSFARHVETMGRSLQG